MNYPWRDGNRVSLLINGEDYYPRVFKAVRAARREILIETFIIFEDKVGRAFKNVLVAAARRGVHIELTVDGYGTAELSPRYIGELTEAGINIHVFDPARRVFGLRSNLFRRMHRKILLIDGECAFIGGINYSADHLGDYGPMAKQDYALEVQGPVVADIHRDVLRMLKPVIKAPSDVCPGRCRVGDARLLLSIRDNADHSTDIEEQYLLAIRAAVHRLVIANAYFFPGYRLLRELRNASRRGVEVTLILQGQPDMPWVRSASRLLYNYLLRDGVRIFEYCQRPFHGKVALMDHEWSTVGSSNLDPLSLALNLEANLFIRDRALTRQLHDPLLGLATEHCTRITLARVTRGYWWRAPLIFIGFHLTRRFPAIAGLLPAHTPRLRSLRTLDDGELSYDQENIP